MSIYKVEFQCGKSTADLRASSFQEVLEMLDKNGVRPVHQEAEGEEVSCDHSVRMVWKDGHPL